MGSLVLSCFDHKLLIYTKVWPSLVNGWILDTGWEMCYSFNVENYAILSGKPIYIYIHNYADMPYQACWIYRCPFRIHGLSDRLTE